MNSIEIEDEDFFMNIGKIKFENNKLIEDIDEELDYSFQYNEILAKLENNEFSYEEQM
jgi:hypothetical protein